MIHVVLHLNIQVSRPSKIRSISFRLDGLGTGDDGRIPGLLKQTIAMFLFGPLVWDLNSGGRISGVLRAAHNPPSSAHGDVLARTTKFEFLPSQDVIII